MGDNRKIKRILKTYREELPRPGRGNQLQRAVCFIIAHLFDPKLTVNWIERRCQIHCKSFPTQFALSTGYRPKGIPPEECFWHNTFKKQKCHLDRQGEILVPRVYKKVKLLKT